jgi:CubicO group peptidase (beta-lactamase class C family)
MKKNIIDRAGMKRAAFVDVRAHPSDVAIGYASRRTVAPASSRTGTSSNSTRAQAGGAFASAPDLVAFRRALWGGKLVNPELVKQFTTGQVAMGPQMQYAFGFGVGKIGTWRQVGHNGGIPGANAEFMMFPIRHRRAWCSRTSMGRAATAVVARWSRRSPV